MGLRHGPLRNITCRPDRLRRNGIRGGSSRQRRVGALLAVNDPHAASLWAFVSRSTSAHTLVVSIETTNINARDRLRGTGQRAGEMCRATGEGRSSCLAGQQRPDRISSKPIALRRLPSRMRLQPNWDVRRSTVSRSGPSLECPCPHSHFRSIGSWKRRPFCTSRRNTLSR
jgi:hypothetical protein